MDSLINSTPGYKNTFFERTLADGLVWLPEIGMGFYPVRDTQAPYDAVYFDKYRQQSQTPIGYALTAARLALTERHHAGELIDVGIGCGQYVEARAFTLGYDVNPAGIDWLRARGAYADLYARRYEAATFWDSLEHIPDPAAAVAQIERFAFVSLPIFQNAEHCVKSKHFRRDEHIWYFEDRGIRAWFDAQGFDCVESNEMETAIGREGIGTYVFKRRA